MERARVGKRIRIRKMSKLHEIFQHTCMVSNYMTCAFVQIEKSFFDDSAEHKDSSNTFGEFIIFVHCLQIN